MRLTFSCASDPGYARLLDGKLICGGQIYRDLNFAVVRGVINPSAARAADTCNTLRMQHLPLHSTVVALPAQSMPRYVSALTTIILRGNYLDQQTGTFRQSCHLYPIAPHLTAWTTTYRLPYTL